MEEGGLIFEVATAVHGSTESAQPGNKFSFLESASGRGTLVDLMSVYRPRTSSFLYGNHHDVFFWLEYFTLLCI